MKLKLNGHVKEHLLTILTIVAVVAGIIVGSIVRLVGLDGESDKFPARTVLYVNFIGDIFLRMLKALILPLIVSSLVSAIGSLDISLSKRIGVRAIVYYMVTTLMAVVLGIVLVTTIRPGGDGIQGSTETKQSTRYVTTQDTLLDLVR
jgi:Na+/H+-dicarboxylate symporter